MSARTRELFSLIVVGVLVGTAFASVYIARQEVVSTESLSYGLFFLGLYVAAHVVTRIAVPHADPYLLPMAGLLTGIGLTVLPEQRERQREFGAATLDDVAVPVGAGRRRDAFDLAEIAVEGLDLEGGVGAVEHGAAQDAAHFRESVN